MKALNLIALLLIVIGALNWGLVGVFNSNLVNEIFGAGSTASRIIYTLVGLAGLYALSLFPRFSGEG